MNEEDDSENTLATEAKVLADLLTVPLSETIDGALQSENEISATGNVDATTNGIAQVEGTGDDNSIQDSMEG